MCCIFSQISYFSFCHSMIVNVTHSVCSGFNDGEEEHVFVSSKQMFVLPRKQQWKSPCKWVPCQTQNRTEASAFSRANLLMWQQEDPHVQSMNHLLSSALIEFFQIATYDSLHVDTTQALGSTSLCYATCPNDINWQVIWKWGTLW